MTNPTTPIARGRTTQGRLRERRACSEEEKRSEEKAVKEAIQKVAVNTEDRM
jgi:hypothetical protein